MNIHDQLDQLRQENDRLRDIARTANHLLQAMHRTDVKLTTVTNSYAEALRDALKVWFQP